MRRFGRKAAQYYFLASSPGSCSSISTLSQSAPNPWNQACDHSLCRATLAAPWSAIQRRGAKVMGSDVRFGNVIQRKGRIFQVLKAQHTQHGRGGATIQVELRDVDNGNKITERFRTDENIERVFVEEKSFTFLYQEGDSVTLMEATTFEQIEVAKELFGKAAGYLKDDMKVTVQYYDGKPMSASVPQRVTCTVVDAQPNTKGLTAAPQCSCVDAYIQAFFPFTSSLSLLPHQALLSLSLSPCSLLAPNPHCQDRILTAATQSGTPGDSLGHRWAHPGLGVVLVHWLPAKLRISCILLLLVQRYKRVLLDNGLTVLAPPFIAAGDEIVVNTTDDTYMTRAKE
ncbi:elongation factor P isoform X2 [Dioscorea cayenensis subsp. rotundata]|uniref:Elongation factor P isoform X2 n=1 Tax=Dioscorea cayennensis subsp. rotundata TaxID=55577 RepID=A0AB40AX78_DIOCR|nr:elongation factor P isoform X2 [Dioscorea cayenensis subsp. rotundata]